MSIIGRLIWAPRLDGYHYSSTNWRASYLISIAGKFISSYRLFLPIPVFQFSIALSIIFSALSSFLSYPYPLSISHRCLFPISVLMGNNQPKCLLSLLLPCNVIHRWCRLLVANERLISMDSIHPRSRRASYLISITGKVVPKGFLLIPLSSFHPVCSSYPYLFPLSILIALSYPYLFPLSILIALSYPYLFPLSSFHSNCSSYPYLFPLFFPLLFLPMPLSILTAVVPF